MYKHGHNVKGIYMLDVKGSENYWVSNPGPWPFCLSEDKQENFMCSESSWGEKFWI